jgi:hypothetical protein
LDELNAHHLSHPVGNYVFNLIVQKSNPFYLKHLEVQPWFCNGVKDLGCEEATKRADEIKEKLREENLVE